MLAVHRFDITDSTNRIAKELAADGAAHGTVVIAKQQTGGRGRLGKAWESIPDKGLYCSIIVRPDISIQRYAQITMVAGLAVAKVVDEFSSKKCMLKWPNDIFFNDCKCGGILTESSSLTSDAESRYAVVGIGLNVNSKLDDFPMELRETVTSLAIENGMSFEIDELLFETRDRLLVELVEFKENGFVDILEQWKEKDMLCGRHMECVGFDGKIIEGIALGPDGDGQLHLRDCKGVEHAVLSGDVRLARKETRHSE